MVVNYTEKFVAIRKRGKASAENTTVKNKEEVRINFNEKDTSKGKTKGKQG